ncbi:MAG: hypothetical protein LIR46_04415 [Bacteroidota bacterium]|nr:hypothetical protein [Bacteroidota bacterium]
MTILVPVDVDVVETSIIVDVDVVEEVENVDVDVDTKIVASDTADFGGPYDITPSQSEQVVEIEGLKATHNIVVAPIPNNYGLITYNGSILTVS